jgi:hypothetical protein
MSNKKAGIAADKAIKASSKITVPVLGVPFEVQFVKDVDAEHSYGETEGPERRIKVKKSLPPDMLEATLLHEIIHAILYTSGVGEMLNENLEEAIVVALENGLSQLYQRKSLTSDE